MSVIPDPAKSFENAGGEIATPRDPSTGQFLKGVGGRSRRGRKKGARARWSEEFMADIEEAWKEQGPTVIARAMFHDPAGTLKALIGILPKHAKLEISTPTDGLTDEQLDRLIAYAEAKIAEGSVIEGRTITVAPSLPPPLADAPPTSAEQRAAAVRREMLDQSEAINAAAPKVPSQTFPHPVGKPFARPDHEAERINRAKLHDDINPEDLF